MSNKQNDIYNEAGEEYDEEIEQQGHCEDYLGALENLSNALDKTLDTQKEMIKIKNNYVWLKEFGNKILKRSGEIKLNN